MCVPAKLFTKADGEPDLTMSTNLLTSGLEQGTLVISQVSMGQEFRFSLVQCLGLKSLS